MLVGAGRSGGWIAWVAARVAVRVAAPAVAPVFALVVAMGCGSVAGQAAEPVPRTAAMREWPVAGLWRVIEVRIKAQDGAPGCLLMTGYETVGGPDYRLWGLRVAPTEMRLILSAANPGSLEGDAIAIDMGGTTVATVKVNERPAPLGPLKTVTASVGTTSQRRILERLQAGTELRFRLGGTEVSGGLSGGAVANFEDCLLGVRPKTP